MDELRPRLYLISPPEIRLADFINELQQALSGGDVASFQLRLKDCSRDEFVECARTLKPIVQQADVAFLINDDPLIAKEVDADGVHVGQEDTPYAEARRLLGDDKIVGVTCHNSRHLAMEAAEAGADYVAFGAFYPTSTKEAKTSAEADLLSWWTSLAETPCVAIGGITVDNAAPLVKSGADFLAISGGVWKHPQGPKEAVIQLNRIIDNASAT